MQLSVHLSSTLLIYSLPPFGDGADKLREPPAGILIPPLRSPKYVASPVFPFSEANSDMSFHIPMYKKTVPRFSALSPILVKL